MVNYATKEAMAKGYHRLFALSTQSFAFFREVCGFVEVGLDELPAARRNILEQEGRRSKILAKELTPAKASES